MSVPPCLRFSLVAVIFIGLSPGIGSAQETKPSELTDREIREAISVDIQDAERMSGTEVSVEVHSGIATLAGTVSSLLDKRLASQIAKRTRGVVAVQNQVIVPVSGRSDDEIRDDVQHVLAANDSVEKPKISIEVSAGEVAMLGRVDSLAEKRIAEFAASGVRGVTNVDNQVTVGLSSDRSDEELREEINALIVQSVYFDDADIAVEVNEQVVKLAGVVGNADTKDRLEQVAEIWGVAAVDVAGVTVDSEVMDPTKRAKRYADVSDLAILEALRRSFQVDPTVFSRAEKIEAEVDSGIITLTGTVNRLRVKSRAAQLAQDVVGVHRVVNELKVEYDAETPPDGEIIHLTQAALARSAQLERREIRVHCQRAHVSLYGIVDSELEKSVAQWIADGVPGVVHVNNSLAVERKETDKSDEEITSDLRRKLKYAFFDKSSKIDFVIEDGVAILRGEVDTWRQWQAAMDLAIESGARHPHNLINVRYHPPHGGSRIYVPR